MRALPGVRLPRDQRDDPAQARRPRPRRRADRGGERDRRRQHAHLRRDGAIEADNTDAGGFLDALGADPAGWRCLVLGAGGSARAVVWALREAGRGGARSGTAPRSGRRRWPPSSACAHVAAPEAADLIVNCTAVGLDKAVARTDALAALGLERIDRPPASSTSSTAPADPTGRWAQAGEAGRRRPRDARPPGRAQPRALDRAAGAAGRDAGRRALGLDARHSSCSRPVGGKASRPVADRWAMPISDRS